MRSESTAPLGDLTRHGAFVRRLAASLLRDGHLAEDVAQEVWARWAEHRARVSNARGWLRTAVAHVASNARRSRERREDLERSAAAPEPPRGPAEEAGQAELLHRVVEAVFALDEPWRGTILARYFRGLSARELAAREGVPPATVRGREQRALALLRERLDRECGSRHTWALGLAGLLGRAPRGLVTTGGAAAVLAPALVIAAAAGGALWLRRSPPPTREPLGDVVRAATGTLRTETDPVASRPAVAEARRTMLETPPVVGAAPPAAELLEAFPLTGTTVDLDGHPLAGVTVRVLGSPPCVTASDDSGRFRVARLATLNRVEAELPGYAFLRSSEPDVADPDGAWAPTTVVLARTGAFALRVLDASGRPMQGVSVDIGAVQSSAGSASWSEETDAAGRARFEGVFGDLPLTCGLTVPECFETYESVGVDGGRLVLDPRRPAQPLVVPALGSLELEAVWMDTIRLRGRCVGPDGLPVSNVRLQVVDPGRSPSERRFLLTSRRLEGDRFDTRIRVPYLLGGILLEGTIASDRDLVFRGGSSISAVALRGRLAVDAGALDEDDELVMRFEPTDERAVPLRVVRHDGSPPGDLAVQVFQASPDGSGQAVPFNRVTIGGESIALGVLPGAVDVVVALQDGLRDRIGWFHAFRDLPVGPEITATLPAESAVRVRLVARGAQPARLYALMLASVFFDPMGRPAERAPRHLRISGSDWPDGVGLRVETGGRLSEDDRWVQTRFEDLPPGAREVELSVGCAGEYAFGWLGIDEDGRPLALACTPLARYEPGSYEIEVELLATAAVEGRARAAAPGEVLGLAVVDAGGRPLPLLGSSDHEPPSRVVPLAADGRFRLRAVPVGTWRVRVGTVEELVSGRFRREVPLEVREGRSTRLDL